MSPALRKMGPFAPAQSERFELKRVLGAGGLGDVYEVLDRTARATVALKVLREVEAIAVQRFKTEFRALADLYHPNLVRLYELLCLDELWQFTMELVDGQDFLSYVRPGRKPLTEVTGRTASRATPFSSFAPTATLVTERLATHSAGKPRPIEVPETLGSLDEERLRDALRQLVLGVQFLHDAGMLHCDIKPSNVLVDAQGRVVLVDFGLVTAADVRRRTEVQNLFMGTPGYVSPEQAGLRALTEASDWYSVGVVLFEALTGVRPFRGDPADVLSIKQRVTPLSPSEVAPGVPPDLDALCRQLLAIDPARRPPGHDVLAALGVRVTRRDTPALTAPPFVGREQELARLEEELARVQRGQARAVLVSGLSGIGKTALVAHFLERVRRAPEALVLEGRCYIQESVPYKALDAIVDDLVSHLLQLPPEDAAELLPRGASALARLFPVLRRLGDLAPDAFAEEVPKDPRQARQRGFEVLRELLRRLGARTLLVLSIDDLQWGDVESAALLTELLRTPGAPAMLLVGTLRSDEVESSAFLEQFLRTNGTIERLELGALTEAQSRALLEGFAESRAAPTLDVARLGAQASGSPFLLTQLAQSAALGHAALPAAAGLAQWLAVRPLPEQSLLEVLAVAGRPLPQRIALRAANLGAGAQEVVGRLQIDRLVRTRGRLGSDLIEVFHDRVREAVLASLAPERLRLLNATLATTIEGNLDADTEALATHFFEAGDVARAAQYALRAADHAAETMAFERAAQLCRRALAWLPEGDARRREVLVKLGTALANSGRSAEAAHAFLEAAERAPAEDRMDLRRRAAESFLVSGHVEAGLAELNAVLAEVGLALPMGPRTALLAAGVQRTRVFLRGLDFRERRADELPKQTLARIDACWAAAIGLSMVDNLAGVAYTARHLLLSLEAGETARVARSLALEASQQASGGQHKRPKVDALLARSEELTRTIDTAEAKGILWTTQGAASLLLGEFERSASECARAEHHLRNHCVEVRWWLDNAQVFGLWAQCYAGQLAAVAERVPALLRDADERGDLFAATGFRAGPPAWAFLVLDHPERVREGVAEAIARWPHRSFLLQHYWAFHARMHAGLYEGDPAALDEELRREWPRLRTSGLLTIQLLRTLARHLRASAALVRAGLEPKRQAKHLSEAESLAHKLQGERALWPAPLAEGLLAAVCDARGLHERALSHTRGAIEGFVRAGMHAHAQAYRWREGELLGGDEGAALRSRIEAELQQSGVARVDRWVRMLAPGRRA